jgi:hypothetical protein
VRRGPGDKVGLTQSLGWVDAWTLRPSVYAVAAQTTDDVVAAVNFTREHNLRVVVKGGGHSSVRLASNDRPSAEAPPSHSRPRLPAKEVRDDCGLARRCRGMPRPGISD